MEQNKFFKYLWHINAIGLFLILSALSFDIEKFEVIDNVVLPKVGEKR